ncbi:MAG: class I SAM-dependent methyltransferase [Rhodanobacteraceae bacterium]|nr:class I SAM-dependent methyltransferase [Rhodanobacteraceae bacterium]
MSKPTGGWARYIRRAAQRVRHSPLHPQWVSFRFKEMAAREVAARARGSVVDIGCADSALHERLDASVGYIGLDYPGTATALYRTRPDVFGDAQQLPFQDASFDCLVVLDVLEHLPRPQASLIEAARVLRPGGKVLLHVPFAYPLHDRPYDFWRMTGHGLEALARGAALEVETIVARGHAIESAGMLCNLALAQALFTAGERFRPFLLLGLLLAPLVTAINIGCWLLSRIAPAVDFLPVSYWAVLKRPVPPQEG